MTKKQKSEHKTGLKDLILLIPNLINLACNITALIRMDACLAGKSVMVVLVMSVVFACVLTSTWFCLLGMLLVYFLSLNLSWLLSLSIVFVLNLFLLIIVGLILITAKRNFFFQRTRQECRSLIEKID